MVSNLMFHVYKLTYHYINSVSYPKIPSLPHSCCYIPDLQLFSIFLHSPTPVVTSLICSYFQYSFTPPLLLLYPWFAVIFTIPSLPHSCCYIPDLQFFSQPQLHTASPYPIYYTSLPNVFHLAPVLYSQPLAVIHCML